MSLKQYADLMTELLALREIGPVDDVVEDVYLDELDTCWWAMTEAERSQAERRFSTGTP